MSVFFAYDGSIAGDWVSHYAIRLATHQSITKLTLLFVEPYPASHVESINLIQSSAEAIAHNCSRAGVDFQLRLLKPRRSVADAILEEVPAGTDSLLIAGTRHREKQPGILSRSVAERLLFSKHCPVLCFRVHSPGILGEPHRVLLPIAEEGEERAARPIARLFASDLRRLNLLILEKSFSNWFGSTATPRQHDWRTRIDAVENELAQDNLLASHNIDVIQMKTTRPAECILLAANRTKSRLIMLDAAWITRKHCFGQPKLVEHVLKDATCDVAIFRGLQ